ncbi:MAG: hypothetical protein H0V74_04655, partial [Chloroflexi bacterium]|nr:hypothetical protein [Chloroflexota bacterium]
MSSIALHGGGEFEPGDEPFLRVVLEAAVERARRRASATAPYEAPPVVARIVIMPTAAAEGRPELSGAHGVAAFERVAAAAGVVVAAETILVVDPASAADPALTDRLG